MKIRKYTLFCLLTLAVLGLSVLSNEAQAIEDCPGTGVLYVYVDTWGGTEAPTDKHGTYDVNLGLTYYIRIWNITEFNTNTKLTVKIGWKDVTNASRTDFFHDVEVEETSGIRYVDVEWIVPLEAMVCTTSTVHYKNNNPKSPDYIAMGQLSNIGHMHFIPETPIGTVGSILALITGLGFIAVKRKRTINT